MTHEVVFIRRKGGSPKGKDWNAFLDQQAAVLNERSTDGWELISTVGVISAQAMETAATSGMLLYFRKP